MKMPDLFRIEANARLAPTKGGYTAIAMFLPLIMLTLLGQGAFGAQIMLGALLTSFGDLGDSRRQRARALTITAIGGALMTGIGRLISGPWWLIAIEIFVVILVGGLLRAYSQAAAGVGLLLTIPLVISLSAVGGLTVALSASGAYLLGGAILMLFALALTLLQKSQQPIQIQMDSGPKPTFATLRAQLTLNSPILRYSLLRALGAACAAAIGWGHSEVYPQWIVLTVIVCSRPDQKTSMLMATQYVIATILGALLADLLILVVHSRSLLAFIVVAVTFLAFTIKDLNYTIYVFFLTNLTLLLVSLATGRSFSAWRVIAILIGAAIVLVISVLDHVFKVENRPGNVLSAQ